MCILSNKIRDFQVTVRRAFEAFRINLPFIEAKDDFGELSLHNMPKMALSVRRIDVDGSGRKKQEER
jgi:hypothetical protein